MQAFTLLRICSRWVHTALRRCLDASMATDFVRATSANCQKTVTNTPCHPERSEGPAFALRPNHQCPGAPSCEQGWERTNPPPTLSSLSAACPERSRMGKAPHLYSIRMTMAYAATERATASRLHWMPCHREAISTSTPFAHSLSLTM